MAEKRKYEHPGSDAREFAAAAHDTALQAALSLSNALRFGGMNSPVGLSFRARLKSAQKELIDAHEWVAKALAQQDIEDRWYRNETTD